MNPTDLPIEPTVPDAMFECVATPIPGCLELRPKTSHDGRGSFTKVFHRSTFAGLGLATDFAEDYYSVSRRGVIRGLHFQRPPQEHAKLVYCLAGKVQDVALDIRVGSPTFGKHAIIELSAETGNIVYLPPGLAHGFCVCSESATLAYKVTSEYSAVHDAGIRWDSAGIPWATAEPVLSDRDRRHPALAEFSSPFRFRQTS